MIFYAYRQFSNKSGLGVLRYVEGLTVNGKDWFIIIFVSNCHRNRNGCVQRSVWQIHGHDSQLVGLNLLAVEWHSRDQSGPSHNWWLGLDSWWPRHTYNFYTKSEQIEIYHAKPVLPYFCNGMHQLFRFHPITTIYHLWPTPSSSTNLSCVCSKVQCP